MGKISEIRKYYKTRLWDMSDIYTYTMNHDAMNEARRIYNELPEEIRGFMEDNTSRLDQILCHAIVCGCHSEKQFTRDILNQFNYFERIPNCEIPVSVRIKISDILKSEEE